MRAAIYTRISRAEDRSGVERHTELCQALCDLRGYEVVGALRGQRHLGYS